MDDQQLVRLLNETLPEDFTPQQIDALRAAMQTSPAVRSALLEELHLEEAVATRLAPERAGSDQLVAQLEKLQSRRRRSRWRWAWMLLLLAVGLGGAANMAVNVYVQYLEPRYIASGEPPPAGIAGPGETLGTDPADGDLPASNGTDGADGNPHHADSDPPPDADMPKNGEPPPLDPVPPPERDPEWRIFDDAPARGDHSWLSNVEQVLISNGNAPFQIDANQHAIALNGKYRLTPPNEQGRVVRLRLGELHRLKMRLQNKSEVAEIEWSAGARLLGGVGQRLAEDDGLDWLADLDERFHRRGVLKQVDPTIDFYWEGKSPTVDGMQIGAANFAVRWTGKIIAPRDGHYKFITHSDDGVALHVDGRRIIHNWTDHSPSENRGEMELKAGPHDIVLEYYQNAGGAIIKLEWEGPEIPRQTVPAAALRTPVGAPGGGGQRGLEGLYCFGDARAPAGDDAEEVKFTHVADDGGRLHYFRRGAFDLRYQDGELLVARGDLVLLTLPMRQPPERIVLDTQCKLRLAELLYLEPLPGRDQRIANAQQLVRQDQRRMRPADLEWSLGPPALQHEADLLKQDDGSVVFHRKADNTSDIWALTPIEYGTGVDVILEIDNAAPGTGVVLDGHAGRHRFVMASTVRGGVLCHNPADTNHVQHVLRTVGPVGRHFFCRVRYAFDHLQIDVSNTGHVWRELWRRPLSAAEEVSAQLRVGVGAIHQGQSGSIRLRSMETRRCEALESLADAATIERFEKILAQLPNLQNIRNPHVTVSATMPRRPDDVPIDQWRRAGYVVILRKAKKTAVKTASAVALLEAAVAGNVPFDALLPALAELPQRATLSSDTSASLTWKEMHQLWEALGARQQAIGAGDDLSTLLDAWYRQDWGPGGRGYGPSMIAPLGLIRRCLYEASGRRDMPALRRLALRYLFMERHSDGWVHRDHRNKDIIALADWMLRAVSEHFPDMPRIRSSAEAPRRSSMALHPLVVDSDRDAANTIAEFISAVDDGDLADACRILTRRSLPTGVVSLRSDRDLSKTALVMLRDQIDKHPDLAIMLRQDHQEMGELRLRQLIKRGDYDGLESLAMQFHGTRAARRAIAYLADRDLAIGNFFSAAARYEALATDPAADDVTSFRAKRRLALAMTGQVVGEPITQPVRFSTLTMPAAEFERMVAQLAAERASQSRYDRGGVTKIRGPAPADLKLNAQIDIPGAAVAKRSHCVAWTMDDRSLAVRSLGHVYLIDLKAKKKVWEKSSAQLSDGLGEVALQPLLLEDSVIVVNGGHGGVELACLDRAKGTDRWRQLLDDGVVSDPLLIGSWLYVVTMRKSDQDGYITLVMHRVSPRTGESVLAERLVHLRAGKVPVAVGRPLPFQNLLLVRTAGTVICCDLMGNMRWIRRLPAIPPTTDAELTADRLQMPMLVSRHYVLVSNLGSPMLNCLDAGTGEVVWSQVAPDARHTVGVLDDKFIVAFPGRLVAFQADTGEVVWHGGTGARPQAHLLAGGDTVVTVTLDQKNATPETQSDRRVHSIQWRSGADGRILETVDLSKGSEGILNCQSLISNGNSILGIAHTPRDAKRLKLFWLEPK